MSSIFTKIVKGEIPSYKIAENEEFLAFLDIMPLVEGHTLVIPKREVDFIFDLEAEEHKRLWDYAREVGKKLSKTYPDKRVVISVVGLEVPHAHIHLMPVTKMSEINFLNERLKFTPEEYEKILVFLLKNISLNFKDK